MSTSTATGPSAPHWAIDPYSESTGTAEAWRCDCDTGCNHVDDPGTCDRGSCDEPIDGEPSWTLPDGAAKYFCSPHHNEPSQLAPEAVALYWANIAEGEPAKDALAAAHVAHREVTEQRRAQVAEHARLATEAHDGGEECSDGL
jgi:hypothetical protein